MHLDRAWHKAELRIRSLLLLLLLLTALFLANKASTTILGL